MKKKSFYPLILSATMLFCMGSVSCSGGNDDNSTVTVEKASLKITTLNVTISGVEEGTEYSAGDVLTFTVTPKDGYAIKEVIVCGNTQTISSTGEYSYTITQDDIDKDNILIYASASIVTHKVSGTITMGGKEIPSEYASLLTVSIGSSTSPVKLDGSSATFSFSNIADGKQSVSISYSFDGGSKTYKFDEELDVTRDITNYVLDLPEYWVGDTFKFYGEGDLVISFTEANDNSNKQVYNYSTNGRVTQNFEFSYKMKYKGPNALVDSNNLIVSDPFDGKLPGDSVKFELQMWPEGTGADLFPIIEYKKNEGWFLQLACSVGDSKAVSLGADALKKLESDDGLTIKLERLNYDYTLSVVDGENVLASTSLNVSSSLPELIYIDANINISNADDFDYSTLADYSLTVSNFEGIASPMDKSPVSGTLTLEESIDSTKFDENMINAKLIDLNMAEYPVTIAKEGNQYTFEGEAIKGKYLLRVLDSGNNLLYESGEYFDVGTDGAENVETKLFTAIQTYKSSLTTSEDSESVYFGCGGGLTAYPSEDYIYQQTLRLSGVNYSDYFNDDGTFKENKNNKITLENRLWLTTQDITTTPSPTSTSRYNIFIQNTDGTDWVMKTDWNNYAIDSNVAAYASDLTTDEVKALITDGLVLNYISIGNTILTSTIDNNGVYREHIATQYQKDWSENLELYAVDAKDRTNSGEKSSGKTRIISNSRVLNIATVEDANVFPTFKAQTIETSATSTGEAVENTVEEIKFSKENCELGTDVVMSFNLSSDTNSKDVGTKETYLKLCTGTDNPDNLTKRNFKVGFKSDVSGKGYAFVEFENSSDGTITRELDNNNVYSDLELNADQIAKVEGEEGLAYYIRNDFSTDRQKFHVYVDDGNGGLAYVCTVTLAGSKARVTGYSYGSYASKESTSDVTASGTINDFVIWAYSNANSNTSITDLVDAIDGYTPIF